MTIDERDTVAEGVEEGIHWKLVLGGMKGHINGYVKLPKNHPFYNEDYYDINSSGAISVHGGLTYSEDGWIGFDTMHAYDYWSPEELLSVGGTTYPREYFSDKRDIWTIERLTKETKSLARQVANY